MNVVVDVEGIDALGITAVEWEWTLPDWCTGFYATGGPPEGEDEDLKLLVRVTQMEPTVESEAELQRRLKQCEQIIGHLVEEVLVPLGAVESDVALKGPELIMLLNDLREHVLSLRGLL